MIRNIDPSPEAHPRIFAELWGRWGWDATWNFHPLMAMKKHVRIGLKLLNCELAQELDCWWLLGNLRCNLLRPKLWTPDCAPKLWRPKGWLQSWASGDLENQWRLVRIRDYLGLPWWWLMISFSSLVLCMKRRNLSCDEPPTCRWNCQTFMSVSFGATSSTANPPNLDSVL